ncbi:MAG: glyoxalase/bleomycin resistance/extradiol dioxygenase family protein [Thermoflexibacter sp.]|jgi:predicted enzyme related to lactoylglutathione lyase|nr:glyoxalase/bleomycin resistance/extradiol dioxygenase family protein [Thermoflexibacter sp.]
MELRLLVIRANEPERITNFFGILGVTFDYHKHGNSPLHYSATLGQVILEIYPLAKNQIETDKNLRLGFKIDNFDEVIEKLRKNEITFLSEPKQTDFGYMVVIEDPEGRKIELYK